MEDMPNHSTVMNWCREDEEIANQYARAREAMTDYRFDAHRDLAAEIVKKYISEGWEPKDAISMARIECDKEKWELSKLSPKKYGDKITQELTGAGGVPLDLNINFVSPSNG